MPEEVASERIQQRSLVEAADAFVASLRRFSELKEGLLERGLEFGGRTLLMGPVGTHFRSFSDRVASELPIKMVVVRNERVLAEPASLSESISTVMEFARRNSPALVLIPEIDELSGIGRLADAILRSELSGYSWVKDEVLVLSWTTRPEGLSRELTTVFDRVLLFDYPSSEERLQVLESVLDGRSDLDLPALAELTSGWGFADMVHLATSLYLSGSKGNEKVSGSNMEELVGGSGVTPMGDARTFRSVVSRIQGMVPTEEVKLESLYPDDFLDQLYLMAVGDDYSRTHRVIETLNAGTPIGPSDREFLSKYPFLLVGTPEDRLTRMLRAKKSKDRLSRIVGR
ncbi:MAG: AAA family ATPase [Candidatus Thorarchaeota archaeon]|nr:AAA family ATPase [Candidatus Thorarchaeota archaeon]